MWACRFGNRLASTTTQLRLVLTACVCVRVCVTGRCLCFHARHYHASLSPEEREAVQAEWTSGDVPIIVATIAFGMGAPPVSSLNRPRCTCRAPPAPPSARSSFLRVLLPP